MRVPIHILEIIEARAERKGFSRHQAIREALALFASIEGDEMLRRLEVLSAKLGVPEDRAIHEAIAEWVAKREPEGEQGQGGPGPAEPGQA